MAPRPVLTAVALALAAAAAGSAPAGAQPGGPVRLLQSPALEPVHGSDGVRSAPGAGAGGPAGVLSAQVVPAGSPAVYAIREAGRLGRAARAFDAAYSAGRLRRARFDVNADSGLTTEAWDEYIDGVRVEGASLLRTVRDGRLVGLDGDLVSEAVRRTVPLWPRGADLDALLDDVSRRRSRIAPAAHRFELGPDGSPVRFWRAAASGGLIPVVVVLGGDGTASAVDVRTGDILSAVSTIHRAGAQDGFPGVGVCGDGSVELMNDAFTEFAGGEDVVPRCGYAEAVGPLGQRRGFDVVSTHGLEHRLIRPGFRILDLYGRDGFTAVFDARYTADTVGGRCRFAHRFFGFSGPPVPVRLRHLAKPPLPPPGGFGGGLPRPRDTETLSAVGVVGNFARVRDYFDQLVGWRGMNGRGSPIPVMINFARDHQTPSEIAARDCPSGVYDPGNAFYAASAGPWGDGGLAFFPSLEPPGSFAYSLEVAAHEFGHVVDIQGFKRRYGTIMRSVPFFARSEPRLLIEATGEPLRCGAPVPPRIVTEHSRVVAAGGALASGAFYPACADREVLIAYSVPFSEGVADLAGVGVSAYARTQSPGIPRQDDWVLGDDIAAPVRRLGPRVAGGFATTADIPGRVIFSPSPLGECNVVTDSLEQMFLNPPEALVCVLSLIFVDPGAPADARFEPQSGLTYPHPFGLVLGSAAYAAIEGGSPAGTGVRGAGHRYLHHLVQLVFNELSPTRAPASGGTAVLARRLLASISIDRRYGPEHPLYVSSFAAFRAAGLIQ